MLCFLKSSLMDYVHWTVESDGALVFKKHGYDITLDWIRGVYGTRSPVEHISEKNWATPEVIAELEDYISRVV